MLDFLGMGEILIDFSPSGEADTYKANPGGAPANVACAMAKLGCKSAFSGKIGNDAFGRLCKKALENAGVNTDFLFISKSEPTTLAFVCLDETGNRDFSFYREKTADVGLNADDAEKLSAADVKIFHFGSVSLTKEPSKSAVLTAVKNAKSSGAMISYDPNLRLPLWENAKAAKSTILEAMPLADILKISEEEALFLFGESDFKKAAMEIQNKYGTKIILITRAAKGAYALINGKDYFSGAYDVKTIDTTGAGDCFLAGFLYCLLKSDKPIGSLSDEEISNALDFANATGSLVTSKKGAIPAIPTLEEIHLCMKNTKKLSV